MKYYATVRAESRAEFLRQFPAAEHVATLTGGRYTVSYCCRAPESYPRGRAFIFRVEATRKELHHNRLVRRVRANPPEEGWDSLNGKGATSVRC